MRGSVEPRSSLLEVASRGAGVGRNRGRRDDATSNEHPRASSIPQEGILQITARLLPGNRGAALDFRLVFCCSVSSPIIVAFLFLSFIQLFHLMTNFLRACIITTEAVQLTAG